MTQPTETDLHLALHNAMDGNLSQSRRRDLLDAYTAAVETRTSTADVEDTRLRAELCAEGDCRHAHQARRHEKTAAGYRHELEHAHDYLDDRDHLTAEQVATLRGILARALDA
ncbi:hypothetical protein PV703_11510 [Streptomyces sp. ME01-24h]|nr:hypothetical protein [Streptomyces sp. ME01-24h]